MSYESQVLRLIDAMQRRNSLIRLGSDVARAIGVSDQTINNWKRRGIASQKLIDVCKKYDISIEWVTDGIGSVSDRYKASQQSEPVKEEAQDVSSALLGSLTAICRTMTAEEIADVIFYATKVRSSGDIAKMTIQETRRKSSG